MTALFESSWYRLLTAALLLAPAIASQTVQEFVPEGLWESASESVYARLLRFQDPRLDDTSRFVVLEVDQDTLKAFGWPIDRSHYVTMLNRLRQAGHPWVLSFLQFQTLSGKPVTTTDEDLAGAITSYGRYVGSGLNIRSGAELSAHQEDDLMPRVTLSRSGKAPESLPYLPLEMVEDDRFIEGQKAFGFGTRFGLEEIVHCTQSYITDTKHEDDFVIPSSLIWVSAFGTEARFRTQSGAGWPRDGERLPFAPQRTLPIGYKICLTSPGVTTNNYFGMRGIQRISLAQFLRAEENPDLAGKIVVIGSTEMQSYRGPGEDPNPDARAGGIPDGGVVPEYVLAARFIDGLATGHIVAREALSRYPVLAWLPLAAAAVLLLTSLFVSTAGTCVVAALTFVGLLAYARFNLQQGVFLIPIQTLASVGASAIGLLGLHVYLRFYAMRRRVRFADHLRGALSSCNTLAEIEMNVLSCCSLEFQGGGDARVGLTDFDRALYEASSDAQAAMQLLERRLTAPTVAATGVFDGKLQTVLTTMGRPPSGVRHPFGARQLNVQLAVEGRSGRLGTLKVDISYLPHEDSFVSHLVATLQDEVAVHWHRIKILVDQKLLDYQFLMERTRGDIMERFLTQVLVSKFQDNLTMEQNLKTVLTPRATKAALLQADIRGYSRISAQMEPLAMVRMLQGYFSNVVDAAQTVAQVKLIGDCIFLFIEEQSAPAGSSPADVALELAAILVQETERQNRERQDKSIEELYFGIAIHYGPVVVGNLSSDSCIDYTVIGTNVNLVARLEELTKNKGIADLIGVNGIVMSPEAQAALMKSAHRDLPFIDISLETLKVAVRSFPDVKMLGGLRAESVHDVTSDLVTPQRAAG